MLPNTARQFWSKVDVTPGCWLWLASGNKKGYGQFRWGGKYRKAHRVSWELAGLILPHGMILCHRCDNPKCVNPDHLFVGTNKDNTQDMLAKGRRRGGCKGGSKWSPLRRARYEAKKCQAAKLQVNQ